MKYRKSAIRRYATAESASLESRIRTLEDIEEIRKLKAKYWRCLDRKLWDELADCFTEDAVAEYSQDGSREGREAIIGFLKDILAKEAVITAHGGHNAEIEILDENTARATWALNDLVIMQPGTRMEGWGYYEDIYARQDGRWRKKRSRLVRYFEELGIGKR